jgi:hypothetical protein
MNRLGCDVSKLIRIILRNRDYESISTLKKQYNADHFDNVKNGKRLDQMIQRKTSGYVKELLLAIVGN